jgi:hypothetical protein
MYGLPNAEFYGTQKTYVQISSNESDSDRTTNVKNEDKCSFMSISVATYDVTVGLVSKLGVRQLVNSILEISLVWVLAFGQLFRAGFQNERTFPGEMKVCPAVTYFQ